MFQVLRILEGRHPSPAVNHSSLMIMPSRNDNVWTRKVHLVSYYLWHFFIKHDPTLKSSLASRSTYAKQGQVKFRKEGNDGAGYYKQGVA